jgi:hypothetical protein
VGQQLIKSIKTLFYLGVINNKNYLLNSLFSSSSIRLASL